MLKRAERALNLAGIKAETHPATAALINYAAQNHGIDPRNYYSSYRDGAGIKAYRDECRTVQRTWRDVVSALTECAALGVTDSEVIECSKDAYSGRMTWTGKRWEYCTGQYWPTEYRQAVRAILAQAAQRNRANRPPRKAIIGSITALKQLNRDNGGTWFSPSNIRFFGTRVESGIIRGKYFLTSEQPPHGPRMYSVRSFNDVGDIGTVGEFCAYRSKADAKAAVPND